MSLALSERANGFVRLPSGRSPREAKVRHFEIGPLHNFLDKGVSEPSWVGEVKNDTEPRGHLSQENSPWITERLHIQVNRVEERSFTNDCQMDGSVGGFPKSAYVLGGFWI